MEVVGRKRTRIDLDKLPIKRLHAIDEIGNEQFPLEKSNEEERLSAIRRIDFSSVVEKEKKKKDAKDEEEEAKKTKEGATKTWQGLVENLKQAQHELSVILDLISTVEANDAVAVAGMQRPKPLPTETLSDIAVSAATKLQRLRHLGRYFRQSSKTMEQQVVKEARFYGSLIRLQQNWKVKRQRVGPGNENFTFELYDTSIPSSISTVRIDQDQSGMLSIQLPQKSCRTLSLKFLGDESSKKSSSLSSNTSIRELNKQDDVNTSVKSTHSTLREIHRSLFEEKVFEMVNRETYNQSRGINVTGMREDLLQLVIGQDNSLCLSLVSSEKQNKDSESSRNRDFKSGISKPVASLEIYLLSIFHAESLSKSNSGGLLNHFCMTVSHRLFSSKVLAVLESLVSRVAYLELVSHPTWQSRSSSWSLCIKVPELESIHGAREKHVARKGRSKLETKVAIKDGQISLKGEESDNVTYSCDLEDLPMLLLQQLAGQVIEWLHEEALEMGMNASRDFLCLNLDLADQGETLSLVAHVDPYDESACISWWLVMVDSSSLDDRNKLSVASNNGEFENRRILGSICLESLYAVLMDVISLSGGGGVGY